MTETVEEVWQQVPGYPGYDVSDQGNVRGYLNSQGGMNEQPHPMKQTKRKANGYMVVTLRNQDGARQFGVHQLVMLTFRGKPREGEQVCHRDGSRDNNKLANLRYGTAYENALDRVEHGTNPQGETSGMSKLKERDLEVIRDALGRGVPERAIAATFGVNKTCINKIKRGEAWAW